MSASVNINGKEDNSIKKIRIQSTVLLLKKAMEASCVEKPPVETQAIICAMASKALIPAPYRREAHKMDMPRYKNKMALIFVAKKGESFSYLSEFSVANNCNPPIRKVGIMEIAKTTMPTPPIQ